MGNYTNLGQILTNSVQLPVKVTRGQTVYWAAQPGMRTASQVVYGTLGLDEIPKAEGQTGVCQYLKSGYQEYFIYVKLELEDALWVGPVLLHPMPEGQVARVIRSQKLPIKKRASLIEHYATLPQISEDQYFYIGKLAELLFAGDKAVDALPSVRREEDAAPVFSARKDAERRLEMFEHPPYFMELEMTRLVTTGDLDSALGTMDRINTFNRAVLAKEPVRSLKNSLICDCTFLARAAIDGGVSPEDAFALSDKLILEIEATHSVPQLEKLEQQHLMEFVGLVHTYNTIHYSKPVREVIGYINNHLGEKITLTDLAGQVFMHPNYLSSLFKKETNIALSRYIMSRRIEEAKFFLRYSNNSISDIAAFYQFSSQSYFIRRFTEAVGVTPLQYRKSTDGKAPM
ncbi:AraC family transcriptional regulator [Ruminococcaceae bacterium OttesenSCG-928-A16]|nr:AraC family transcriptional regulator [Ruminococcaceae bacterium OttesenSCG-928-A16]